MFKQAFGSPRLRPAQEEQEVSILSPRNFIKFITKGYGELKNNLSTPNQANYQQFVSTFTPYLQSFQPEIKKYHQSRIKKDSNNTKNQELQLQLKINRIPTMFFVEPQHFKLELFKRGEAKKKQEEMSEFLDEIELVLFVKTGKYPEKSKVILQNMDDLEGQTNNSLEKVIAFRKQLKQKLFSVSQKQLKVKNTYQKSERIRKTIEYLQLMKKIKSLKDLSEQALNTKENMYQQLLLKTNKTQIEQCNKLISLKSITKNIQNYRLSVKQKLYKQFLKEIQEVINQILKYNKQKWKDINVPQAIFVGQQTNTDVSHNNITVLQQSYFAFQSKQINIVNQRNTATATQAIQQQNQDELTEVLNVQKIGRLWTLIKQFDLYDETEVNEQFTKILVRHNISFNHDMQEYINYLYTSLAKQKASTLTVLKGPQTYASIKNKLALKQESKIENQLTNEVNLQISEQKIAFIDMKLFIKIVKFYFGLLKKVLQFVNVSKNLQFLNSFKFKFAQFLEGNIMYFINLKKIQHDVGVDDFLTYLQIINYWQNQEFDEIVQFCQKLKQSKIDQYLTNIQKYLLIKEIKQNIEQSTFLPINVSSDNYMTFHHILLPQTVPHYYQDQINMSMTLQLQQNCMKQNEVNNQEKTEETQITLRLINKNIIYKNKVYKICDSFLQFAKNIEKYVKLKEYLPDFQSNIQQKICELIGFYAWYNQKYLTNPKNGVKTLKNYCTFYSTVMLLKEIIQSLSITNKKLQKTRIQLNECETQISKSISMTPFMMIEEKVSQLYESKISTRNQMPTPQTQKIIDVLKITVDCFKQFFPIEYEESLQQSNIIKFLQTTIKLINKNYFGYLVNMEKRGIAQVKWFLPKLKQVMEMTIVKENNLLDKRGNRICKDGRITFAIFNEQIEQMQRILRQKTSGK